MLERMSDLTDDSGRNFAANMKAGREALGWSQADLARELASAGINQTAISRMEKGERAPKLPELAAISAAFNTGIGSLLGPPEKFREVFRLYSLLGRYRSTRQALIDAADAYEEARAELQSEQHLIGEKLSANSAVMIRARMQTSAADVVKNHLDPWVEDQE